MTTVTRTFSFFPLAQLHQGRRPRSGAGPGLPRDGFVGRLWVTLGAEAWVSDLYVIPYTLANNYKDLWYVSLNLDSKALPGLEGFTSEKAAIEAGEAVLRAQEAALRLQGVLL